MSVASLDQLRTNTAIVNALDLSDSSAQRLKSLGVFEGQRIEVARRGNPLIVKAAGSRIAIASELAKNILVQEIVE